MQMTNEEIVRDYKAAANKSKQIKILAELNTVSPGEIRAVLAQAGVEGVEAPKRFRKQKPEVQTEQQTESAAPPEAAAVLSPALPVFYSQVQTILTALPEHMSREAVSCTQNLLQTLFADYLEQQLGEKVRDEG